MNAFVDDYGLNEFDHIADQRSEIWRAFEVSAQPSFVFINDTGGIRRHIGGLAIDELAAEIDLILES